MLSPLLPLQASSLFLVTLIQELDKTEPPRKEYWVNTHRKMQQQPTASLDMCQA